MDHLCIPIVCNCMKFGVKSLNLWLNYIMKTKSSMVAAAVLNLFLIASLNMPSLAHGLPLKYQILCIISICNWVVGTSSDSRWRACRISISKTWLLTNVSDFWCWFSISMMQKFDWRLNCGSNYGFLKIWFLTNGSPQAVFFIWVPNLVQNVDRNSRWRPSAILELLNHHTGPPTKSALGYISLLNFMLIRYIVLKICGFEFWIFCGIGLKCLFTPQNFGFWGLDL